MLNIFGKILAAGIFAELLVGAAGDDGINDHVLDGQKDKSCSEKCKQCKCQREKSELEPDDT